jgi:glycosyltransferase involved in cell wall biosynthesis
MVPDGGHFSRDETAMNQNSSVRIAMVQDGSRLHYAVPVALHRQGALERVFCDFYASPHSLARFLAHGMKLVSPVTGQRMLDRYEAQLTGVPVISNLPLVLRVMRNRKRFASASEFFYWEAAEKTRWMLRRGFGRANAICGFIRNIHPDLCLAARQRGLRTIGDQMIAPAAVERAQDATQRALFPEWVPGSGDASPAHATDGALDQAFEEQTWPALDQITCASNYVRDGLVSVGIAPDRILVNPYPVDDTHFPVVERAARPPSPLRVGFVGAVSLRKGAPWFLEVARRFDPAKVRFVMVGPMAVSAVAAERLGAHVELAGSVPRSRIPALLADFDLYFFPSTCEGSAGSVMEAMMTGLPVIASPNAGSVVRDGIDGRIIPYDQVDAAAEAIQHFVDDRAARLVAGYAAAEHARSFSLDAYARRLLAALDPRP